MVFDCEPDRGIYIYGWQVLPGYSSTDRGPVSEANDGRMDLAERRRVAVAANRADRMSVSSSSIGRDMSDEEAQAEQAVQ